MVGLGQYRRYHEQHVSGAVVAADVMDLGTDHSSPLLKPRNQFVLIWRTFFSGARDDISSGVPASDLLR